MMIVKKRNALLTVLFLLLVLLVGCGQEEKENPVAATYTFTDSAGRTVELPKQIDRIAPSGGLAQMALFAIAPDKLVGISGQWKDAALPYVGAQYRDLPVLGQFYGMKNFNKEAVLSANPQVIIDVGEKKETIQRSAAESGSLSSWHVRLRSSRSSSAWTSPRRASISAIRCS